MACVKDKKLQNGKLVFRIQAKIKDELTGKGKFVCTTWKNPENLTGKAAKAEAIAYAVKWEKELRNNISKKKAINDIDITFRELATEWLRVKSKSFSESYYARCQFCLPRLIDFFGDYKFVEIKPRDVHKFFDTLAETQYNTVTALVKENKRKELNEIAKSQGVRQLCNDGSFARPTLYNAYKGNSIAWKSAEAICRKLKLNINDFFDRIEFKKSYERNTILKYKTIMCSIYRYAINDELVEKNYASMDSLSDHIAKKKPKKSVILSNDELNKLLATLEKHDINQTIPIYLITLLGLREAEVCGLEFQDIDFENKTLRIERNRIYIPHVGIIRREFQTKTENSKRTLSICDLLYEKLLKYKTEYYDKLKKGNKNFDNCGAVYCNINGSPAFPHHINTLLRRFLVEAGCKVVSPHKMRHLWITTLIDNGVKPSVVAKMAGHANPKITLEVYTQYRPEEDNSSVLLNDIFSKSKLNLN